MSNKLIKPLSFAIGTGLVGSLALAQIAQANPAFHMSSLAAGYALAAPGSEGKCGEGKCGEGKCGATKGKKCMEMSDKAAQDKCMTEAHAAQKGKEGSCSADKKGKEGSCSADKKGKEGSCSADKKGKEGSCSGH